MALLAALLVPGNAQGEVGVVGSGEPNDPIVPYILGVILDEPDPFAGYWLRSHEAGGAHHVLNDGGSANGDGRPEVVLHPATRVPLVVWSRNGAGGYDVVSSRFENGAWTPPEVLVDELDDALDPRVAIDPMTGDVHLVYWIDGSTPRVEHRVAPADLSTWSPAVAVSGPGEVACRPHAAFHDGTLRIAYEVHVSGPGSTPREVIVARQDGEIFVPEIVALTPFNGDVRPEVHSHGGTMWIDWVDEAGTMGWTRFDAQAETWETIRSEPFGSLHELEFHVRGAIRSKATQ
jgi:hypothetical protein